MFYYVYQITNTINGKIYVGKHKSKYDPLTNGYFGSGKMIKDAIIKYGKENFIKTVLFIGESLEEISLVEQSIVTAEFVSRSDTYNMHVGGKGGFDHINCMPVEERVNIKAFREKHKNGLITFGGSSHITEEGKRKILDALQRGRENGNSGGDQWSKMSEQKRRETSQKISDKVSGSGNGMYGTHWYIDENFPAPLDRSAAKRFKEGEQPDGWVTLAEWKDKFKTKTSGVYGKMWYNDGVNNFMLDPKTVPSNLVKGRLGFPKAKAEDVTA